MIATVIPLPAAPVPKMFANSVSPEGLKHAPASSLVVQPVDGELEGFAVARDADQAVNVSDAGCQGMTITVVRARVVLAQDQAATRRHRQVVGRIQDVHAG